MGVRVRDSDGNEFRRGVYRDAGHSVCSSLGEVYEVSGHGVDWVAKSYGGSEFKVSLPRGLPDSERMLDGEVNGSCLVRMNGEQIQSAVRELDSLASLTTRKRDMLRSHLDDE